MPNQQNNSLNQRPNSEHHYHISLPIFLVSILLAILVGFVGFTFFNKVKAPTETSNSINTQPTNQTTPSITVDETANWETYINEEYGFEFRYPSGFQILSENKPSGMLEMGFGIAGRDPVGYLFISPNFTYNFSELSECVLPAESDEIPNYPCLQDRWEGHTPVSDLLQEGIDAEENYVFEGIDNIYRVVPINSPKNLELKMQIAGGGLNNKFEKILSTFELHGDTSTVPSDWQTYTNEEYGFSFKYPSTKWTSISNVSENAFSLVYSGARQRLEGATELVDGYAFHISVQQDTTAEGYINSEYTTDSCPVEEKRSEIESTDMSNISGLTFTSNCITENKVIAVSKDDYVYVLILVNGNVHKDYSSELHQILSTFQFQN